MFDGTAAGVVQELDFRHEARNCYEFGESLRFLGYVDVPKTIPELTTRRALGMEWVYGRHLSDLSPEEAMRMTYMSVEAVTAGLVLTGKVYLPYISHISPLYLTYISPISHRRAGAHGQGARGPPRGTLTLPLTLALTLAQTLASASQPRTYSTVQCAQCVGQVGLLVGLRLTVGLL